MRTARLATLLLLSASACVAQGGEDLNLDGLPSYDADTGGGKGDDPNCTDASYREFIQGYFKSELNADANPCVWGNDASYRIWAYAAGEQLKPMLSAYSDAALARYDSGGTKDSVIAAGTLDDATRGKLEALEAIRPAHAGKVGAAAWIEYLYGPSLDGATSIVASGNIIELQTYGPDQYATQITPFEDEWLSFAERNQPVATEAFAYTQWWPVVQKPLESATHLPTALEPQKTINATFVSRLAATHPAGAFDEDQTTFQTEVTAKLAASYGYFDPSEWAAKLTLQPSGGGIASYTAWATAFGQMLGDFTGFAGPSDEDKQRMQLVIGAKPCASGPDVDALVQRLTTNLASAGNAPDGTPWTQVIVPVACAQ